MSVFLKTRVTEIGPEVADLAEGGVVILFADGSPPELAEVSVLHRTVSGPSDDAPSKGASIAIGGLSATDIVTYVTVSQALLMVIPQWGRVEVADTVRSGQIAVDLCRPMDYFAGFLSKRLGVSAYYILFRFLPLMAVGLAAGLLSPPSAWETLPAFLATVVMGAWIANSLLFLVDVSAFWLGSERGLRYLFLGAGNLFSGLILPLSFLPEEMQKVSLALPFEYTLYLPVEVYLGRLSGVALASAMTIQLAWVVGLTILCRAILSAGVRKLVIHGG